MEHQNPADEEKRHDAIGIVPVAPLKLTDDHPSGSFVISPATIAAAPAILSVSIIRVVNPEKTAVEVFVYLVRSDVGSTPIERILVGQFGLFPPDHPASFMLRSSGAFQKLQASRSASASRKVLLVMELKPISGNKTLTKVELTVAPPEWRADKRD
jgi:hypothetical protein